MNGAGYGRIFICTLYRGTEGRRADLFFREPGRIALDIIIWESEDLVHWEKERAHTVGIREAGCVWAPEAVFDEEEQAFLVFFASKVKCKEGIIRALSCGHLEMNRIRKIFRNLHMSTGIPSMNWHMRQTRLTVRSL